MDKQHSVRANLAGAIMVGMICQAPFILACLLLLRNIFSANVIFEDALAISVVATIVVSTIVAFISRAHEKKLNRYTVHGVLPTFYQTLPWPLVAAGTTVVLLNYYEPSIAWLGFWAGFLGGAIPELVIHRPWKEVMSEEEYEKKLEEGTRIVREGLAEIREDIAQRRKQ